MRVSKQILFSAILGASVLLSGPAPAQDTPKPEPEATKPSLGGTFSVQIENDKLLNTDRHYTNGIRIGWVSDRTSGGPDFVRDALQFLYPLADIRAGRVGFAFGHTIFTPEDTELVSLIPDDRPYAGWLFVGASLHAETSRLRDDTWLDTLDSVEATIGIVGPHAFGEQVQNNFHKLFGIDTAKGWENQLRNEPALNLVFGRRWRPQGLAYSGIEADAIPFVGGSLGNVFTLASTGLTLRLGQNLKRDYGPPQIHPALSGLEAIEPWGGLSWYLFAGVEGRAVAHNVFLDGNLFTDSHSVDRKVFVADFQIGAAIAYDRMRVALTHITRSREFEGQKEMDSFASLNFSLHF